MTSCITVLQKPTALFLLAAVALAQDPQTVIRVGTQVVVAPTVVVDKSGNFVNGLTPQDFVVYDNDKPQEFKVDVAFQPIDVMLVVQADGVTDQVLPKIRKIAPLLENLVVGEQGQIAVMAFDHRLRLMQDFTSDSAKVTKALEAINTGS